MAEIRQLTGSAVAVGRFNPLIFHPTWLLQQGIIGQLEAERTIDSGIEILHPELASLNLSNRKLIVEAQRFLITATEEPIIQARDFAASVFSYLSHTPVWALGINYEVVLRAGSEEAWHRFGDKLAPKDNWAGLLGGTFERTGGLRALVMERSTRKDGYEGYKRVHLQALDGPQFETRIQVNDHYQFGTSDNPKSARDALDILDNRWDASIRESESYVAALQELAE